MQDRPDAPELAAAVAVFLRDELLPAVNDPRLAFRLRVAANGLSILERELRLGAAALDEECALLAGLLGRARPTGAAAAVARALNAELCTALREERAPPATLDVLRRLSALKLSIASPATSTRTHPSGKRG
ncbi:MAG: DUF6285 domain-containing protein [Burkholderiales bacterium]